MTSGYLKTLLAYFAPILIGSLLVCGLIYGIGQQILRQNANDPQIQITEEVSSALAGGAPPSALGGNTVDIANDLAPFIILFDQSGKTLASQAVLDGHSPVPPAGVFTDAATGQNRITWQPKPGVRIAAVINEYHAASSTGFVLAGRSLREVEIRENNIKMDVFLGWLVIAGLGLVWSALMAFRKKTDTLATPAA